MSLQSQFKRVLALHRKLFPFPKAEIWLPRGVCVREVDGLFFYANEEAQAIDERCKKLGITPNVYSVSDEWNPDMDGINA